MTILLTLLEIDFVTALTAATTAITNVGPGLGDIIGPAGNFASLPDAAKWVLSFAMLLGRLEIFTLLLLFDPHFWRD
ncbi:potassium transporter TrkG [Kordiimonas gwangyangensis]|uniref:potassium transporter TrkG n=1 Tax=Kordiimonas gwangyangensis TaxID=288022 RepID=UPI000B1C295F|nr:potassium transporter TrkG [Kordiimonas gwangyangensis]